jgi:hypothetical protein
MGFDLAVVLGKAPVRAALADIGLDRAIPTMDAMPNMEAAPVTTVFSLRPTGKGDSITSAERRLVVMPGKRPSVKNEKQYEGLKKRGMSKSRAARIANSPGSSSRGGRSSGSGSSSRSSSRQGGTSQQKKAAGRKGGKASARNRS